MSSLQSRSDQAGREARRSDGAYADLTRLGWGEYFERHFETHRKRGLLAGRVALSQHGLYQLHTGAGLVEARLSGRFRHQAGGPADLPVVGDWVAVLLAGAGQAAIQALIPRRTAFVRKAADSLQVQVLAANIDTALLVGGLDRDLNLRRLERYLVAAWESGASPVMILSKADLCLDVEAAVRQVEAVAPGVPVHPISVRTGAGLERLAAYLAPGGTLALLGSSGVGKSSLVNHLLGQERQRTAAVREGDSRGRHTTTWRELLALPGGALIVDTPGLRELQPWEADDGHRAAFDDLESLAAGCRFQDCSHEREPRCAVRQALDAGLLEPERYASYLALRRELRHLETRLDRRARLDQKRADKTIQRQMRTFRPRA